LGKGPKGFLYVIADKFFIIVKILEKDIV